MHQLVLASASPRRKELLASAGYAYAVFPCKVSEKLNKELSLEAAICDVSRRKARAAAAAWLTSEGNPPQLQPGCVPLILSGDTMVILDASPVGKPKSPADAMETLLRLSGRTHEVWTALTLMEVLGDGSWREKTDLAKSEVEFRTLSKSEVQAYVATEEPMDKAGSYAIQGKGGNFVKHLQGDRDNVIGLPLRLLRQLLEAGSWQVLQTDPRKLKLKTAPGPK